MSSQPGLAAPPLEALPPLELRGPGAASTLRSWVRFAFFLVFLGALFLPLRYPQYFDPAYRLPQFNRFMALALFALSVDMIWGYTGLLSLGQGLYFGMGAYIVAWSLNLQQAAIGASERPFPENRLDRYVPGEMTEFMKQCRLPAVPEWISPLIDIWVALPLALLIPTIFAFVFGYIVFKRRIKGVYFSLITQALVYAVFHLVSNQRPYTGGVDGQTNLAGLDIFGILFEDAGPDDTAGSRRMFYLVTGILVFFALVCYFLVNSKFGKILTAIRDNEFRVMALGYNTAMFKTFIYALSGLMAALAGALFVAANQSAGPQFFSTNESIEVVIFVAVGGRGTLIGAIIGALLVNWGKDYINSAFAVWWPVVLGGLFVAVVLFLPEGIVGGVPRFFNFVRIWFYRRPGLSTGWNMVRVGFGLLYWGLVSITMAIVTLVVARLISKQEPPPPLAEMFTGLVGKTCLWMLIGGGIFVLAGQCLCGAVPGEARGKKYALGALAALGLFMIAGAVMFSRAAPEAPAIPAAEPINDGAAMLSILVRVAAAVSLLLLAWFVRGVAIFYQHEALAKSVRGFLVLAASLLASMIFLGTAAELSRDPPALGSIFEQAHFLLHPFLGAIVYLVGLAYTVMLIVLPAWFLRLLYQAHECINRPLSAS